MEKHPHPPKEPNMRFTTLPLLVMLALGAGACGSDSGQDFETPDTEDTSAPPSPAMQAQFGELRSEVDSVVGTLRAEVDSLQRQAAGDTLADWTEAATTIQEREGELLMELDRLPTVDLEEARDIRNDIASQLAGLEGDVVRRLLEYTSGPTFADIATDLEDRLAHLEQSLDSIESRAGVLRSGGGMQITRPSGEATEESVTDPPPPGDTVRGRATAGELAALPRQGEDIPDPERIRELREEIQEVRGELEGLREADDMEEWNDAKGDIAEQVAELTREIREHWYNVRYSFRDVTAMGATGGMGQPGGEE
jgi:hypothetical protein